MDRPVVHPVADLLWEDLPEFQDEDAANGYGLLRWLGACSAALYEPVWTWIADRDDMPGWAILMNRELAPANALPWLAQFAGVRLDTSLSEAEQREQIKLGNEKGTTEGIKTAIRAHLSGTKNVVVEERFGGNAWTQRVRIFTPEIVTSEAAALASYLTQKPAGLTYDFAAILGQEWEDVDADFATWAAVDTEYATWDEVRRDLP